METKGRKGIVDVEPGEGRAVRMAGARVYTRKVGGEQTGGAYSLFEVEVGPGGGERSHVQHREDECFWVLEGRFEFLIEGAKIEAGAGSLIYVPKGELHAFENTGDTTGRLLVLHTPAGAHERFLEEVGESATVGAEPVNDGSTPPAASPSDPGRLARIAVEYGIELVSPP